MFFVFIVATAPVASSEAVVVVRASVTVVSSHNFSLLYIPIIQIIASALTIDILNPILAFLF